MHAGEKGGLSQRQPQGAMAPPRWYCKCTEPSVWLMERQLPLRVRVSGQEQGLGKASP